MICNGLRLAKDFLNKNRLREIIENAKDINIQEEAKSLLVNFE